MSSWSCRGPYEAAHGAEAMAAELQRLRSELAAALRGGSGGGAQEEEQEEELRAVMQLEVVLARDPVPLPAAWG